MIAEVLHFVSISRLSQMRRGGMCLLNKSYITDNELYYIVKILRKSNK